MSKGAPLGRMPVELELAGVTDLCTLVWLDNASITGEVSMPHDVEPDCLYVLVDEQVEPRRIPLDASARFRIDDLATGPHTLNLEPLEKGIAQGKQVQLDLSSGETFTVPFDARDRGVCHLELTVLLGDAPAEHVQVRSADPVRYSFIVPKNPNALPSCDTTSPVEHFVSVDILSKPIVS